MKKEHKDLDIDETKEKIIEIPNAKEQLAKELKIPFDFWKLYIHITPLVSLSAS